MSDPSPTPVASSIPLKPWTMLAGFVVGVVGLALAGRAVTEKSWHRNFTRFHPMIGPESQYEPSVNEMRAIVRAAARPDQILVVVGGNSILFGVGQPADRVWTRRLQALLGDKYAVVNLAFRGSSPSDGGAIVAETLRQEYPRQVYIANAGPMQAANAAGGESYRFMTLDAYFKGLLLPWAPRDAELAQYFKRPENHARILEQQLYERADAVLRFHDFWNWWTYTKFSTFATTLSPRRPQAYRARSQFADVEPDFVTIPVAERFKPEFVAADMVITRQWTAAGYERTPNGSWKITDAAYDSFKRFAHGTIPDELKRRTLILVSRNSPFYTRQLPAEVRDRDEIAIRDTIAGWEGLGYSSMDYGSDFVPEDFGDRTHLTTSGGAKLAALVAPKVREMAQRLGYIAP